MSKLNQWDQEDPVPADMSFSKTRLEYCISAYELEVARQQALEKKSQFYITILSVFLGAFLLNSDFLSGGKDPVNLMIAFGTAVGSIIAGGLVVSLFLSIITILLANMLRTYKSVYPRELAYLLFQDVGYLAEQTSNELIETRAMEYALATENDRRINDQKARLLVIAVAGISLTLIFLALSLGLSMYQFLL